MHSVLMRRQMHNDVTLRVAAENGRNSAPVMASMLKLKAS